MVLTRFIPIALLLMSHTAFAETEFLATYTDVESIVEAKKRLGREDIQESELLRTHYVVEKDLESQKVIIRPLQPST